jgi:hypothetical protein
MYLRDQTQPSYLRQEPIKSKYNVTKVDRYLFMYSVTGCHGIMEMSWDLINCWKYNVIFLNRPGHTVCARFINASDCLILCYL